MDGLGFSLCAVLFDIIGSIFPSGMGLELQQGEWRSGGFQTGVSQRS